GRPLACPRPARTAPGRPPRPSCSATTPSPRARRSSFWAVHTNPEYWPDPQTFDPERFTPEASANRPRLAYIPFGLGPRSCEGATLATVEAKLVLACLLKRFRLKPAPGQTVTPIERFVLWAADDIHMILAPRDQQT